MRTLIKNIGQVVSGRSRGRSWTPILVDDHRWQCLPRWGEASTPTPTPSSTPRARTVIPGPDRLALPSGLRRLHAAPADHGLHRVRAQRRAHDDDLGWRGAPARAAQGHRRGSRRWPSWPPRPTANLRARRGQGARGAPILRARPGGGGLRRRWRGPGSSSWARSGSARSGPARTRRPWSAGPRSTAMTVTIHTGGPSIAGSSPISAEVVLGGRPHVVGHINGGTTSDERARDRLPGGHRRWRSRSSTAATARPRSTPWRAPRTRKALHRDHHRQRRAVRARAWCRSASCGSSPTWPRSGGLAPEAPSAWPPATPRAVYGLPVGVIEPGREADLLSSWTRRSARWGRRRCEALSGGRPLRHLHGADRRADQDRPEPQHAAGGARPAEVVKRP